MRTPLFVFGLIISLSFISCHKDQPSNPNEIERVQMISFKYLFDGDRNDPNDIKIVFDSTTSGICRKRKGYDTTKPYIDSNINISSSQWKNLIQSFNIDSIMVLSNNYTSEYADEGQRTLEVRTTSRYKKIIYYTSNFYPFDSLSKLKPLESLNNQLWNLLRVYFK
jgi:hypothetical protein